MSGIINSFTTTHDLFSYRSMLEIVCLVLSLLMVVILYVCMKLLREKRRCVELESYLKVTEKAIKELRTIRHQYNNMFQSIVFYLENELQDSCGDFINEIMEKTAELNKNNVLQMVNIKNYKLRSVFSEIIEVCDKNGINLSISVSGEVNQVKMNEAAVSRVIGVIFHCILDEVMRSCKKEFMIEICSDSQGVSFTFDSTFEIESKLSDKEISCSNLYHKSGQAAVKRIIERNKNIIFNSYFEDSYFRQEIMILQ